jgi:hypothetical protein
MFSLQRPDDQDFCIPDVTNYTLNLLEKATGYVCMFALSVTKKKIISCIFS